eukprot:1617586-Amphidinium_carterae.1
MHTNYFQNATFKAPIAEYFVPPFAPTHFAQLDYIITKSCFSNASSDCKALVATDSDHLMLKARFRFMPFFTRNCSTLPKAEKYLPPSDPQVNHFKHFTTVALEEDMPATLAHFAQCIKKGAASCFTPAPPRTKKH